MNISKKRKITAWVTLSIMLVAIAVTACIMAIPNFYKGDDVATTGTATAYGSDQVSYNANNTNMVYGNRRYDSNNGYYTAEGDIRVLFPKTIYLDKTESLQDAGYYFGYDVYTSHSSTGRMFMMDNIFGYYPGVDSGGTACHVPSTTSQAYTMHNVFGTSYGRQKVENISNAGAISDGYGSGPDSWTGIRNTLLIIGNTTKTHMSAKVYLQGSIKDGYISNSYNFQTSGAVTATYTAESNVTLAIAQYKPLIGDYKNCSPNCEITRFETTGSDNFTGISSVAGSAYVSNISVQIYIYDKSALNTAINNFESNILTATNKTILNKISGSDTLYNNAQTYLNNAKAALKAREVTQDTINDYTNGLNNYVFDLPNFPTYNRSKEYDGKPVDISTIWSRFDPTYYNLTVNNSTTSTEIKNADGNQSKVYNVSVSPKSQVGNLKLRWADTNDRTGYKAIGTYTIEPATFQVTGLQRVTRQFKNSNYDVSLAMASTSGAVTYSGFVDDNGNNVKHIYLVIDEAGKDPADIDWTGAQDGANVSIKDVGNYTVYYKVTASNHYDCMSSFAVEITKANIELLVDVYPQTYGDPVLDSDGIIENMLKNTGDILDATTWEAKKAYIKQICTFSVAITSTTPGTDYANVGNYTINFTRNTAWDDKINTVSFKDLSNREAYHVVARQINVKWTQQSNMYYDGTGNKRPSVSIVGDNFVVGTTTALKDVEISGPGQDLEGNSVPLVSGDAINAGKYEAYVECVNSNYEVDPAVATCQFEILRRPITVELQQRSRTYAGSTYENAKTATLAWRYYIDTLFPVNLNQTIYRASIDTTLVKDGRGAIIGGAANAPQVFEIDLAQIDDESIYTSTTESERYFKVGTYDLTLTLIDDKNYVLTEQSRGAKFIINPATIDLDLQRVASKAYNATSQNITITNNNTVITLQGYEAAHRSGVTIEYKDGASGTYTTTPLAIKDVGTKEIYYRVSAPNHTTAEGHFTAEITPAYITINVKKTASATYGDEVPTSAELIEKLGIELIWASENNKIADINDRLAFEIQGLTDRRANAGRYDLTHKLINDELESNFVIDYATDENGKEVGLDVYIIGRKTLYVDWTQSGANWAENGMDYSYDGDVPEIKPVAPDMYDGKENVVVIDATNRDIIQLAEIELDDDTVGKYTVTTSLANPDNINNYVIQNPTATFNIVPRVVEINVKNQRATYGRAKEVAFYTAMLSDTNPNTKWAYPSGVEASAKFLSDDYSAFRLVSEAHSAPEGKYMDAGDYDIDIEPIDEDVAKNYTVRIVKEGAPADRQAIFTIAPANIHFGAKQFNIDFDNEEENNYVTKTQMKNTIDTNVATPSSEFTVEMSDLFKEEDAQYSSIDNVTTWVDSKTRTISQNSEIGEYYVWVRVTHLNANGNSNYAKFETKVQVNILSGWVSIRISEGIEDAQYGNDTHTSLQIFEGLTIAEVDGIKKDGSDTEYKTTEEALKDLEQYVKSNKIRFYVLKSDATEMTKNTSYGDYTIEIEVLDKTAEYKYFRFLDEDGKANADKPTTNIDAYKVGQRIIGMDWGVMDEIYGEHSDSSNSHTYTPTNLMGGDDVQVTVKYQMQVGDRWVDLTSHARNVGQYRAIVTEVSHPDYKLPDQQLMQEFKIDPRPVKLIISDRPMDGSTLVYGSDSMSRSGIDNYLNTQVSGFSRYTVSTEEGYYGFVTGDTVANIFRFKLESFNGLDSKLEYLSVGTYNIIAYQRDDTAVSANYEVTYDAPGTLKIVESTGMTYGRNYITSKVYTGQEFSVVSPLNNVFNYINLTGDGDLLLEGLDAKKIVQYKLATDDDSKYDPEYKVKNAGTYTVNIKVDAPNHTQKVFTATLTVARAYVVINMGTAEKDYGDTVDDLIAKDGGTVTDFSGWLKKYCGITITAYNREGGSQITVAGIDTDFQFKVIQKGQGNGAALAVGKNPVGTYRVYHENDTELSKNYIINYYQDPSLPDDDEHKCNSDAYKINKKKVNVTWVTEDYIDGVENRFEYSNSAPNVYATLVLVGDTTATVIPSTHVSRGSAADKERASAINVGLYTAKIEFDSSESEYADLENYDYLNNTYDFEIVPKKVTVIINNQSFVYGTNNTKVGVWASHTAYVRADGIEFPVGQPIELSVKEAADNAGKTYYSVGTYSIVGKCTSSNYTVTFKGQGSDNDYATFDVTEATMSVSAVRHPVSYNGKAFSVDVKRILAEGKSYTIYGDMKWDDAIVTYKQEDGTYTDKIAVIDGITSSEGLKVDYKVELANHNVYTGSIIIEIRPAKVVVKISKGATTVYGESLLTSDQLFVATKATLDVDASSMEVDLKSILELTVEGVGSKANRGTYNIGYELKSQYKGLYEVELVGEEDAYEVTAKTLTVEWDYTEAFEYNGLGKEVTYTLIGIVGNDVVEASDFTDYSFADAGTYTATIYRLNNRNYVLAKEEALVWTINPKSIEIEWVAGDFTYNGEIHTLATPIIKDDQLVEGDICDIVVVMDERVNAGTHTATAESINSNYVISNDTFEFVIKPAVISITWDDTTLTYNGEEQAPTATIDAGQLIGEDKCEIIISGAQKDAGKNYTATATLDNTNYVVSEDCASFEFAIDPKAITFEWIEETKTLAYTGEQQTPRAVAVDAVTGDAVEFEIIVGEGKEAINVGEYIAIVKGVLANSNYIIDEAKQTSMTTNYKIVKGVNEFVSDITVPDAVNKLPWSGDDKPEAKWGSVVVKYYSDAECTQEVIDINKAGEGKYWIKLTVAGTENYDELNAVIEVVLEGDFNFTIAIVGAIVSFLLLIGALIVVEVVNIRKHKGGIV